jgi:methyl-accepting chemotaxis protein
LTIGGAKNTKMVKGEWAMSWKNLTIGKKIASGFGIVMILLVACVVLSFTGVGGIVGNASQVIDGNILDCELAQKEVDHLNWSNKVNALLTDERITKLEVETDDHKCAFGQWLYGERRRQAEALVPSLASLFKAIEEPHLHLHESAKSIDKHFKQADPGLPGFLAAKEADHLKWAAQIDLLFLNNLPELTIETNDHKCSLGQWLHGEGARKAVALNPELGPLVEALKEPHRRLHLSAVDIQKAYAQIHPGLIELLQARLDDHRRWAQNVAQAIIVENADLNVETDPTLCAFGKFLASEEAQAYMEKFPAFKEAMEAVKAPHEQLHQSAKDIQRALALGDREGAKAVFQSRTLPALEEVARHFKTAIEAESVLLQAQEQAKQIRKEKTIPALEETRSALNEVKNSAEKALEGMNTANQIYAQKTLPALSTVQKMLGDIRQEAKRNIMTDVAMLESAKGTKRNVGLIGGIAVVLGVLLALIIARGITKVLQRTATSMDEAAGQVASASGQVSSASQQLAEGASENAASLEETSSSLEEMSSMTKQNADNAVQANSLMQETHGVVTRAADSMKELTSSMEDISVAGQDIGKIIKTIDEIAFQTNLLALNAAVEAARAGEAGQGFAVVADEVRNLAQRAAEAAGNTSELIEGTIQKIQQGSSLVHRTDEAFSEVTANADKVAHLVGEIAAASQEQAQGIEQINTAMTQMDHVTQQNAANAEESASASEELNAQAFSMKDAVDQLMLMVGGNGHNNNGNTPKQAAPDRFHLPAPKRDKGLSAEALIPLDDPADYSDF